MVAWALLLWLAGAPEVLDSAESGFTVRSTFQVSASAEKVFEKLVDDVGKWWDPAHTWSGKSENLSIEAKAGGCFCEKLDGGGSVEHLTVVYADKGKTLRMRGALGPLQEMAVTGTLTFSFVESESGTTIVLDYRVSGYSPEGLEALAPVVDEVLRSQLGRLGAYVEGQ